jgi:hypothetical protein
MILGEIRTFPKARPDKIQVNKILEESAEVFSAWEKWNEIAHSTSKNGSYAERAACNKLVSECADVIQATSNLVASLGFTDFSYALRECEYRNDQRGRYDIQESD